MKGKRGFCLKHAKKDSISRLQVGFYYHHNGLSALKLTIMERLISLNVQNSENGNSDGPTCTIYTMVWQFNHFKVQ